MVEFLGGDGVGDGVGGGIGDGGGVRVGGDCGCFGGDGDGVGGGVGVRGNGDGSGSGGDSVCGDGGVGVIGEGSSGGGGAYGVGSCPVSISINNSYMYVSYRSSKCGLQAKTDFSPCVNNTLTTLTFI